MSCETRFTGKRVKMEEDEGKSLLIRCGKGGRVEKMALGGALPVRDGSQTSVSKENRQGRLQETRKKKSTRERIIWLWGNRGHQKKQKKGEGVTNRGKKMKITLTSSGRKGLVAR